MLKIRLGDRWHHGGYCRGGAWFINLKLRSYNRDRRRIVGRLIVIAVEPLYTSLDDLNKLGVSREFLGGY